MLKELVSKSPDFTPAYKWLVLIQFESFIRGNCKDCTSEIISNSDNYLKNIDLFDVNNNHTTTIKQIQKIHDMLTANINMMFVNYDDIKLEPNFYKDKPVWLMVDKITVETYYNYAYREKKDIYYSFITNSNSLFWIYLEKDKKDILQKIRQELGKVNFIKISVTQNSFSEYDNSFTQQLEIFDIINADDFN
jgi:hypothetical protein